MSTVVWKGSVDGKSYQFIADEGQLKVTDEATNNIAKHVWQPEPRRKYKLAEMKSLLSDSTISLEEGQIIIHRPEEFLDWLGKRESTEDLKLNTIAFDEKKLKELALWLEDRPLLRAVNLDTRRIGPEGLKIIAPALFNQNLAKLRMSGNNLSVDGIKELVRGIFEGSKMSQLYIGNNRIQDEGLAVLSGELKQNPNIIIVDVSANMVTGEGLLSFLAELEHNETLSSVNFRGNQITEEEEPKILEWVKNHPAIVKFSFSGSWDQRILDACAHNQQRVDALVRLCDFGSGGYVRLLTAGVPPHVNSSDGVSALHVAARRGDAKLMQELLKHTKMRVPLTKKKNQTPLDIAKASGNLEIIELLETASAPPEAPIPDDWRCPIGGQLIADPVIAADEMTYERQHIERWLQGNDKSPVTNERLKHKELIGNATMRKDIASFVDQNPHLRGLVYLPKSIQHQVSDAIDNNDTKSLERLLKRDERIFTMKIKEELTLFDIACEAGIEILALVLQAYPEHLKPKITHQLCANVSKKIGHQGLELVFEHFGDQDMPIQRRLIAAVRFGSIQYVEAVIELGAHINGKNEDGITALHEAACYQGYIMISRLIQLGANSKIRDKQNQTPAMRALGNSRQKIAEYIEDQSYRFEHRRLFSEIEKLNAQRASDLHHLKQIVEVLDPEDALSKKLAPILFSWVSDSSSAVMLGEKCEIDQTTLAVSDDDKARFLIRSNDMIELINQSFQILSSIHDRESKHALVVKHYASYSQLMRLFHMLGILHENSELLNMKLPRLVNDSVSVGTKSNCNFLRNQLMHYAFIFENKAPALLATIRALRPVSSAIQSLKATGAIETSDFSVIDTCGLPIFDRAKKLDENNAIIKDKQLTMQHLRVYFKDLRLLYEEANQIKSIGSHLWEHDGPLHSAISGISVAIGQRLRDLKNYHSDTYDDLIKKFKRIDPEIIQNRNICGYHVEGTPFEIDRAMWGHVFNEDDERPGIADSKMLKQAAFELIKSVDLWKRLEFGTHVEL